MKMMTESKKKQNQEILLKQERMAKALRENLFKRKTQQRERQKQESVKDSEMELFEKSIDAGE